MQPNWTPEHVIDPQAAGALIAGQFPELSPVTLTTIGEGYDNTVYRVNDAYSFRFPRREIAVRLLLTECALLPALASLNLPLRIPELHYRGVPTESYRWPFAGYGFVPGLPPGPASAAAKRSKAVRPLAQFLRKLHGFPVREARALGVQGDVLGRMDIPKRIAMLHTMLEQAGAQRLWPNDADSAALIVQLIGSVQRIGPLEFDTLVHGDLHIRNVLADEDDAINGVIDWGDVHIGHPAIDLSIAYSYVPPEERMAFFSEYQGDGQSVPDDDTKLLARFFAVFAGFALLVYAGDRQDSLLRQAAHDSIMNALQD